MIFPNRIRHQMPYNNFELPQYSYQQNPIIHQSLFTEQPKHHSIEKLLKEELLKNDFFKSFIREIME